LAVPIWPHENFTALMCAAKLFKSPGRDYHGLAVISTSIHQSNIADARGRSIEVFNLSLPNADIGFLNKTSFIRNR
jgi:hypothetical protein